MKKFFFVLLAFGVGIGVFAQVRPHFPKGGYKGFKALKTISAIDDLIVGSQSVNPIIASKSVLEDHTTMVTTYDAQTNGSDAPRIYRYPDGSIGATCTWSQTDAWADRGTGYNYFNGSGWGPQPTSRVETSIRTGWPSYAPFGANGEIFIAHNVNPNQPLIMGTRTTKGTGAWTVNASLTALGPPSGATVMAWPRMVTNGTNRNNIHIIALTLPTTQTGGVVYQGLDGAVLYNRSTDGGVTWIGWQLLPGMTATSYLGFGADTYSWAEPKGDTLAFTVGPTVVDYGDQFIMKSTDNGTTWTKTIVWHGLYNLWTGGTPTDTFYTPDGSSAAAIDKNGKVHVVFGRLAALGDATGGKVYFANVDGLAYWNENMAELPQLLDDNSIFIGWVHDPQVYNEDPATLALYQVSLSSMPQIVTDEHNYIFAIWSSVSLLKDNNTPNYMLRHLYARASTDGGATWHDSLVDLNHDFFLYHFTECVYPSASPTSTDSLYILFMGDQYAGTYLTGSQLGQGQQVIDSNYMYILKPSKLDIILWPEGINEKKNQPSMIVSQNAPNPFKNQTQIDVMLNKPGTLSLDVYSLIGQKVMEINKGSVNSGNHRFTLNSTQFSPGIYFYTVKCNNESSTRKMIVE